MSNAANAKPQVEVELDRLRKACFDMNALCEFEKVTGKNCLFDREVWVKPTANEFRALVWATLRTDDPNLTLEGAGELIQKYPAKIKPIIEIAYANATAILAGEQKKS